MRFSSALEIKISNLIYSPFEKFKTRFFFQNKKANKEKKVIGKEFKEKSQIGN